MKILNLTIVKGDDWEGVYDQYGRLIQQGHKINWYDILSKNVCKVSDVKYVDLDWISAYGILPDKYSEVMFSEV